MPTLPTIEAARLEAAQVAALGDVLEAASGRRLTAPLEVSLMSGGRSNLTYRVRAGSEQWVLRRPPLGHVLETAHDMAREYRVLDALQNSAVPVPRTVCHVTDPSVLGADFYVMELIDGRVFRTAAEMATLAPDEAVTLSHAFI